MAPCVQIHAGAFLDGFMFEYADGTKQAFGNPSGGSPTKLKVQNGEHISKIVVRSGGWLDAAQIILDSGRSSPMCGGNGGGVRVVGEWFNTSFVVPEFLIHSALCRSTSWACIGGLIRFWHGCWWREARMDDIFRYGPRHLLNTSVGN